jgi:tetratricopeptide (TPR) repeat protein
MRSSMPSPRNRAEEAPVARAGFLAGGGLSLVIALALLLARVRGGALVAATALLSPTPAGNPVMPSAAPQPQRPEHLPATAALQLPELDEAEQLLEVGNAHGALEILEPLLEHAPDGEQAARLNFDLGMAEYQVGRFQRAAGYLEAAVAYGPTAERLYWLAVAYDTGGDHENALGYYLRLAEWQTEEADEYRDFAVFRVQAIIELIGTPTPSN